MSAPLMANLMLEDPPYYFQEQISTEGRVSDPRSEHQFQERKTSDTESVSSQSILRKEASHGSSGEFRSIIDDLTVENKLLKRKLRQYKKQTCAHLDKDKLFEMRFHGLSSDKKHELGQILQHFVAALDEPMPQDCTKPSPPSTSIRKPSKAQMSSYKSEGVVDSAYASASNTEPASKPWSPPNTLQYDRCADRTPSSLRRNINSYLNDIPQSAAVQSSLKYSDDDKKSIIVRRLEQLFTGKSAAEDRNDLSHQQEEISQSAARARRRDAAERGQYPRSEGLREARILSTSETPGLSSKERSPTWTSRGELEDGTSHSKTSPASEDTPDQRPTRPLDLDLDRAQISSDNIEYIKHLGLSSPVANVHADDDDEGWIYLNLLINMAQLHVLNVTPEFIKKAVSQLSVKFELSSDGRRIRWKGGVDGTSLSAEGRDNPGSWTKPSRFDTSLASRAVSAVNRSMDLNKDNKIRRDGKDQASQPLHHTNNTGLGYTPLFVQRSNGSDDYVSWVGSDVVEQMDERSESSTHLTDFRTQSVDGGRLVFYGNGLFYTDPNGDSHSPSKVLGQHPKYTRLGQSPLGYTKPACSSGDGSVSVNRHLLASAKTPASPKEFLASRSSTCSSDSALASLDVKSLSLSGSYDGHEPSHIMAASGLGGVQPEDNFVVEVRVEHMKLPKRSQVLGHSSTILQERENRADHIATRVVSTKTIALEPATVPPPSFVHFPLSSSTEGGAGHDNIDDDDDDDDDYDYDEAEHNNNDTKDDDENDDDTNSDESPSNDPLSQQKPYKGPALPNSSRRFPGPITMTSVPSPPYVASTYNDDHDNVSISSTSPSSASSDDSSINFLSRSNNHLQTYHEEAENSDEVEDAKYMQEIYPDTPMTNQYGDAKTHGAPTRTNHESGER